MPASIKELARSNVYIGTSSWKYPGWRGLVYKAPYKSEKEFEQKCLEEYATIFPTVGVDHTYYSPPLETTLARYDAQTPEHFKFGFKVTESATVFRYPKLKRYGKLAGQPNDGFLNADRFEEEFLRPIQLIRKKLGPILFEFSHFYPGTLPSGSEFVSRLDAFLGKLAIGREYLVGIEIRNRSWLVPDYFKMLEKHHISHVFNSWTKMPTLLEQLELTRDWTQPAYLSRVLLQPGTKYEQAVEAFSPYDKIQEVHDELRRGAAGILKRAIQLGVPAYTFVNNRAEGCAPMTIDAILKHI